MFGRLLARTAVVVALLLLCATLFSALQPSSGATPVMASDAAAAGTVGAGHVEWGVVGLLLVGGLFMAFRPRKRQIVTSADLHKD